MKPEIDLIVPVHIVNEEATEWIKGLLGSLLTYTPRRLYNLICVIDRGWDGTESLLQSYYAKGWIDSVLRNTAQRGFTRTCNIGLEQSSADYSMLLNMDIVVSEGWLDGLLSCAKQHCAGVVGCKLINSDGTINHAGAYGVGYHRGMNELNTQYFEEEEVEWVTGAALVISKKLRDTIGNLDEKFPMWGSDREYCKRAKEAGFSIWYSPVTLLHYGEKSTTPEIKELFKDAPR